jgi:MFS family permease
VNRPTNLLAQPAFRRFWIASTVSGAGSQLTLIAYPLLVLSLGGSAAQVGVVGSTALIARFVCRLPGGHVADLVNARVLMISMDLVRLAAVGSVAGAALAGALTVVQLLVTVIVEGAATAAYTPASTIMLRDIAARDQLVSGLSWLQAAAGTVAMIGPLLGGALFAVHPVVPFAADTASYAVSVAVLPSVAMRRRGLARRQDADPAITAGLRWLWQQRAVTRVVLYASVLNLAAAGAEVLVLLGLRRGGASSVTIGLILACAGIGAVAGAMLAGRILTWLPANSLYLVVALVWTTGALSFAVLRPAWFVGLMLVALMLLTPATGVRLGDITVNRAPGHLLGRVSTAQGMLTSGFASLGPVLAGGLLDTAGLAATWLVLAAICLGGTAIAVVSRTPGPDLPAGVPTLTGSHGQP